MMSICPCGSALPYQSCCQPLHLGTATANSAQQLMMSRYAAFVTQDIDYLICTHSPATRSEVNKEEILQWARNSKWLALEIIDAAAAKNKIEFIAWYKIDDKLHCHHELSLFTMEQIDDALNKYCHHRQELTQAWYYHSAIPTTHRVTSPKRNDPCICGSGKKFKRCCDN